jgi:hypothetical protein
LGNKNIGASDEDVIKLNGAGPTIWILSRSKKRQLIIDTFPSNKPIN